MKKLLFFLIFPILSIYSQNQTALLGTWKLIKEEPKETGVATFGFGNENPEETVQDLIIQFNTNGNADIRLYNTEYYAAKFILNDSLLILGNQEYIIKTLSENQLILKENQGIFPKTNHYQKINEKIKSTPEKEDYVEYFENGNIKISGEKLFGYQNGKWIEYYENGKIKSEKYYYNAIPLGIWKYYDENGKLLNEVNKSQ